MSNQREDHLHLGAGVLIRRTPPDGAFILGSKDRSVRVVSMEEARGLAQAKIVELGEELRKFRDLEAMPEDSSTGFARRNIEVLERQRSFVEEFLTQTAFD